MKREVFPLTPAERQRFAAPEYFRANWRDTLRHAGCVVPIFVVCVTIGVAVLYNAHYLAGTPIWFVKVLAFVLIAIGCLVAIKLPLYLLALALGGSMRQPRLRRRLPDNAVREVLTFTAKRIFDFDPCGGMPAWLVETTDGEWIIVPVPQEHFLGIDGWEPSVIRYQRDKGWYGFAQFCWPLVRCMNLPDDITFSGLVQSNCFAEVPPQKITSGLIAQLGALERAHQANFQEPPESHSYSVDSPLCDV